VPHILNKAAISRMLGGQPQETPHEVVIETGIRTNARRTSDLTSDRPQLAQNLSVTEERY
jgi:hypothetical protein